MTLNLRRAPDRYDRDDQSALRADVEREDKRNVKRDAATITSPLDISGSGAGQIKFPATQNASTDANTLDDYEEVSIVPTVTFGGAAVGVTYAKQTGSGTKIGNRFFFQAFVQLSSNGTSVGGFKIVLGNAPSSKNTADLFSAIAVRATGLSGVSGGIQAHIEHNTNTIELSYSATGTAAALSDTTVTDNGSFIVSGSYQVD